MMDERLGMLHFWVTFIGFHTTFLPPALARQPGHAAALRRLPADGRVHDHAHHLDHRLFLLGAATFPFVYDVWRSWKYGALALRDDPWGHGNSLEWATSSPPPRHNFVAIPRIRSERPAFEMHYPHLLERLQAEAHAGRRREPYVSELIPETGPRQGPNDPDPT